MKYLLYVRFHFPHLIIYSILSLKCLFYTFIKKKFAKSLFIVLKGSIFASAFGNSPGH